MTDTVNDAPDPDSAEFQENSNTVEKVAPDVTADEATLDASKISTDPTPSEDDAG